MPDFSPPPVFVCARCGRGFLTAQPSAIDQYPLWRVLSSAQEGEICGGHIVVRARPTEPKISRHVAA